MFRIIVIALIATYIALPPWVFFSLVGLTLYYAYYFSKKQDVVDLGKMRLPTWFSQKDYMHIFKKADPKAVRNLSRFFKMAAILQSKKKKEKQLVFDPAEIERLSQNSYYNNPPAYNNDDRSREDKKSRIEFSTRSKQNENNDSSDYELFDGFEETQAYTSVPTINQETPAKSYLRKQKQKEEQRILKKYRQKNVHSQNKDKESVDRYAPDRVIKPITCPKCDMVFHTKTPQVCHLADCYYDKNR